MRASNLLASLVGADVKHSDVAYQGTPDVHPMQANMTDYISVDMSVDEVTKIITVTGHALCAYKEGDIMRLDNVTPDKQARFFEVKSIDATGAVPKAEVLMLNTAAMLRRERMEKMNRQQRRAYARRKK